LQPGDDAHGFENGGLALRIRAGEEVRSRRGLDARSLEAAKVGKMQIGEHFEKREMPPAKNRYPTPLAAFRRIRSDWEFEAGQTKSFKGFPGSKASSILKPQNVCRGPR
jgi:hypothetical protein